MTTSSEAVSPVGRRRHRIKQLEVLAARVADELAAERAALRRMEGERPRVGTEAAARPPASTVHVREWARRNGWPNLAQVGKIPAEVLAAYEAANGPDPEVVPTYVIREWARQNGWPKLGSRGNLPADVLEAYAAEHGVTP